jgi:hypothetical protein
MRSLYLFFFMCQDQEMICALGGRLDMGNYPTLSVFSLTGDFVHVLGVADRCYVKLDEGFFLS